jgi:hypothetical protein
MPLDEDGFPVGAEVSGATRLALRLEGMARLHCGHAHVDEGPDEDGLYRCHSCGSRVTGEGKTTCLD